MQATAAAPVHDKHSIFHPQGIDGRPVAKVGYGQDEHGNPYGPDRSSPTLLTLTIRPRSEYFVGGIVTKARGAGFLWTGIQKNHLGILSRDTDLPIATLEVDGELAKLGQLSMMEILFDPEHSEIEYDAGLRVLAAGLALAESMGGDLCDGLGNVLDAESCEVLKAHIDEVMERRIDEHQPAPVELPDGALRVPGHLSFQYHRLSKTRSGTKHDKWVFFDAPELHYNEGRVLGFQMALEMVKFIKAHRVIDPAVGNTLAAAMGAPRAVGSFKESRDNAACGFMEAMEALIKVGARHANLEWFEHKIERLEQIAAEQAKERQAKAVAFTQRMRAARTAKKSSQGGAA